MRRALAAAMAAITIAAAAPAAANEAQDKAAAQKLLKEGNDLLGEGDYVAALEKFRAAHARYPSAKILLNIGTTLRQLGRNIEAADAYEAYLKDPKADPTRVAGLKRILQEIDAVIARLHIEVNEPGATVRLDGKEIPGFQSGAEIRVEAGEHTVVAERAGLTPAIETLKLAPHDDRVVRLRLAPPEKVMVAVPVSSPQRPIAFVVGGVGLAGLAAGGIAGGMAIAKNQAAKGHCLDRTACDAQGVALGKAAKTSALVSSVTFAAGGAALVTGIVLFATAPRAKPAATVGAGVSAGGPFVTVEGSW